MDRRSEEVCKERRFWFGYLSVASGMIGDSFDTGILTAGLGTDDSESLLWWHKFTGWYEGVIEEADGQVEHPGIIQAAIGAAASLRIEVHPGDQYFYLAESSKDCEMIANIGPHWSLPGFTVPRLMQMASDPTADQPFAVLLSAPITWLRKKDDVNLVSRIVEEAWASSGLISGALAKKFAAEWARCNDAREVNKSWALPGAPIDVDHGQGRG